MAHPLLYSSPDTFDFVPSEEHFPWLGLDFPRSDPYIPGEELFYDVELISSLEDTVASWGPEAPVWAQAVPAPPLTHAYGSGPSVESYYFDRSTDPISKSFKPTDICLADPMGYYPMPEIGCNSLELYGSIDPLNLVSKPLEFTVLCN